MSESNITIAATFPDIKEARKVEAIMNDLYELTKKEDMPFHEYLESKELTKGMSFPEPSWWIPEKVERKENVLNLKLIGSPSGYCEEEPEREDDVIVWLRLCGAENITGELVISGGGDVEVVQL
jgi:hypothetical protein